jgi:hypothetical protein
VTDQQQRQPQQRSTVPRIFVALAVVLAVLGVAALAMTLATRGDGDSGQCPAKPAGTSPAANCD